VRVTASSTSIFPGGLRAALILAALVLFLLSGPRSSLAAVGSQGFSVTAAMENETSVVVDGDTAVWVAGGSVVKGKNLTTNQALTLPAATGAQDHPSVSGRTVVWEETSAGDSNVYAYNLFTNQRVSVAVGASDATEPAVDGNLVVWQDNRNGNSDIYAYNLDTRQETPVTTAPGGQYAPAVSSTTVVWEDRDALDSDVVVKDLAGGGQQTLTGLGWQESPQVGGDTVVWQEDGILGDFDVSGYDLGDQEAVEVADGSGDQLLPTVDGRIVAWVEDQGGNTDVRGKDLTSGETFLVAGGSADQLNPDASGERVAWEVQRTGSNGFGTFDLQGARLDLAPLPPSGLAAEGSTTGVELDWAQSPEGDLAGYNVYRAGSEEGSYTRLNSNGPLSASSFTDPNAPKGSRSFYKVVALDNRSSESGAARASAMAPRETGISLSATPAQIDFTGGTATLSGQLTSGTQALPGKAVVTERRPEGQTSWTRVAGGATTDPDGRFSLSVPGVDRDTEYRAVFEGSEDALPSTSDAAAVDVKTVISVRTSLKTVKFGRNVVVSGLVLPNKTGEVRLSVKRGTTTVRTADAPLNNNVFRMSYRPNAVGRYTVTAAFGSGPDDANTVASTSFTVKRVVRR
jgi:beta propeller repeat protein